MTIVEYAGAVMGPGRPKIGGEVLVRLGDLLPRVDERAARADVTRAELIRTAVQTYLDAPAAGAEFVVIDTAGRTTLGRRRPGQSLQETLADLLGVIYMYAVPTWRDRDGVVQLWERDLPAEKKDPSEDEVISEVATRVLEQIGIQGCGRWSGPLAITMAVGYKDYTDPDAMIAELSDQVLGVVCPETNDR
jgi:hypothetical protein